MCPPAVTIFYCVFGSASSEIFSVGDPLEHSYTGEVKDNENGTHSHKCVNGCGEYGDSENCYDVDEGGDHFCDVCGAQLSTDVTPLKPADVDLCAMLLAPLKATVCGTTKLVFGVISTPFCIVNTVLKSITCVFKMF